MVDAGDKQEVVSRGTSSDEAEHEKESEEQKAKRHYEKGLFGLACLAGWWWTCDGDGEDNMDCFEGEPLLDNCMRGKIF